MTQNTNTPAPRRIVTTHVHDEVTWELISTIHGPALHYGDMAGGGTVVTVSCKPSYHVVLVRRH